MVKKKAFIDKENSLTFQVVHRSQRDPRIADETASKLVLRPIPPSSNLLRKGKGLPPIFPESLHDHIETEIPDGPYPFEADDYVPSDEDDDELDDGENREQVRMENMPTKDDPSIYGVFFDDQEEYDYLKHMKVIGEDPNGTFVPAATSKSDRKEKKGDIQFMLPEEALPSKHEDDIGLLARETDAHDPTASFDPHMDPSIRQVLEALEDDAFVDEDLDEDFFGALDSEDIPDKFVELANQVEEEYYVPENVDEEEDEEDGDWMRQFQKFKKDQQKTQQVDEDSDVDTDATPKAHHQLSAPQSHRPAKTATTSYSMSSSSMFRNRGLTLLDDQFERVLAGYDDDEIGELDPEDPEVQGLVSSFNDNFSFGDEESSTAEPDDETIKAATQRVESLLDEFLQKDPSSFKQAHVVSDRPLEIMDAVRDALRDEAKKTLRDLERRRKLDSSSHEETDLVMPERSVPEEQRWDVESVLTTYSNIYNHPTLIPDIQSGNVPKIRLKGRQKMPVVAESVDSGSEDESEDEERINKGVARPRNESKEEKKARKAALKAEKQERRANKKELKSAFKKEEIRQAHHLQDLSKVGPVGVSF